MSSGQVVITGLGVINGAAADIPSFQAAILQGKSGIGELDLFDVSPFPAQIGSQVKDYRPHEYFTRHELKHLSRTDQFALIAAREAVAMSAMAGCYDPYEIGVCVGGGVGGCSMPRPGLPLIFRGREHVRDCCVPFAGLHCHQAGGSVQFCRVSGEHHHRLLFFGNRHRLGGSAGKDRTFAGSLVRRG